jgi:flagellar basal body-associated protein FliL
VIKFALAAIWICAATIGSIFFAFSAARPEPEGATPAPAYFGGLDYVKTDVISIPVVREGGVQGYFIARLVYTVEKEKMARMSVPAQPLLVDELYTYLYANPDIDFTTAKTIDLAGLKAGIRDAINAKLGETVIHEVLVEQVDYLSKADIRDNNIRRKATIGAVGEPAEKPKPAAAH